MPLNSDPKPKKASNSAKRSIVKSTRNLFKTKRMAVELKVGIGEKQVKKRVKEKSRLSFRVVVFKENYLLEITGWLTPNVITD